MHVRKTTMISVKGSPLYTYKFSKECNPLPGDKIIAYFSKNKYSIHKVGCDGYNSKKGIEASWMDLIKPTHITIKIMSKDRVGLFADIRCL